jgi:colanic acid biosynthesis glycosyl transferase WcaI
MPKALIFYHYFHPDDVVSATHVSGLAAGLVERGWQVMAMPCNRGCREESRKYPRKEEWNGVQIRRVWRPAIAQASAIGRMVNAAWMIVCWSLAALTVRPVPDVVIVGTDPILSVLVARFWKLIRPKTRIVHWCFDLYPEAAVADGILKSGGVAHRFIQWLVAPAYSSCDLIADIGSCMRAQLARYPGPAKPVTLTPWALSEPAAPLQPDAAERDTLFGDAQLTLLYSGNFGRAHSYEQILDLARGLDPVKAKLVFSVRGNREHALRAAVGSNAANISFCEFAAADRLEQRLSAPDVHVVSLRPEWTGMVVPSKFFGAIAAGRPVLFAGSCESAVAMWIKQYCLGWVLTPSNVKNVGDELTAFISEPEQRAKTFARCYDTYRGHFSKEHIIESFDSELRDLLPL